jgi:hypothetical protein
MENAVTKKQRAQPRELQREKIIIGIRFICMSLFLYTAYAKTVDHERFLSGLSRVQLIARSALYISWLVPAAEIVISFLLLIPKTAKVGLYSFMGLMTVFTGYIFSVLLWEKIVPCHCGGVIEKLSWAQHIWFNLAFITIAIVALRLSKSNLK